MGLSPKGSWLPSSTRPGRREGAGCRLCLPLHTRTQQARLRASQLSTSSGPRGSARRAACSPASRPPSRLLVAPIRATQHTHRWPLWEKGGNRGQIIPRICGCQCFARTKRRLGRRKPDPDTCQQPPPRTSRNQLTHVLTFPRLWTRPLGPHEPLHSNAAE